MRTSTKVAAPAAALLALGLLSGCAGGGGLTPTTDADGDGDANAVSCGTLSLAVVDDDSHRAGLYALTNGLVESDIIDGIDVEYLQIPALVSATGSDQYTFTQTAVNAVPLAIEQGLDVQIVALGMAHTGGGQRTWVRADSGLDSVSDLKDRTVGILGLGSTGYLFAAKTFNDLYGIDPAFEGGDVRWTELDPSTLLNAVQQGQIDAAVGGLYIDYAASQDPELKLLGDMPAEYRELTGQWPVGAAYVVQTSYADANPECVAEFQRLLTDSAQYTIDNADTVLPEIAEETGADLGWLEYYWAGNYEFVGFDQEWFDRGQAALDVATEFGRLPESVDIAELTFTGAGQ